tara:strand:- start:669 stop:1268 length:600 start_codon:yes stop_codon:yes gene_type:complete
MDNNENDIAKNFFNSVKMNDHLYASSWVFTMIGIIVFTITVALNVNTNNAKSIPLFIFIFAVIALMIVTFFKTIQTVTSSKDDGKGKPHIKVLWQTIQNWIPGLLILTQLGLLIELNVENYKKVNYNNIYGLFAVIFIIIQITIYINYVYNQYIIGNNNNTSLREKFLIYYPWFLSIFVGFFLTSWFYAHTKSRITDDY